MTAPSAESFFNLFTFDNCLHDAVDGVIVYEGIKLEKSLYFDKAQNKLLDIGDCIPGYSSSENRKLILKGQEFAAVWFVLGLSRSSPDVPVIQFIDWIPGTDQFNHIPDPKTFLEIPLAELANHLRYQIENS